MSDDILIAYNQTEYFVDEFDKPIQIGQTNAEVEELLNQYNVDSWCFITAWNPMSVELTLQENLERNNQLKEDLSQYKIFAGEGSDPKGEWQPERSFLVLGISKNNAEGLAEKYRQRAIVFGEKGKPAELLETIKE